MSTNKREIHPEIRKMYLNPEPRPSKAEIDACKREECAKALGEGKIPSAWVIESWGHAERIAEMLTRYHGRPFLPCDEGEWTSPRYKVIEPPKVGDPISFAFNGDSYPCGHIAKIGKNFRIITSDKGERFYRRLQTAGWRKEGGTWWLVQGHVSTYNREF